LNILYAKNFLKDLAKVPEADRKKIEQFSFSEISNYTSLQSIKRAEKLQGHKGFYKIRFGNYRVGIQFINNTITFERVMHRKEIYKYFP
jgi:mRNA interferase RelE/StbE